MTSGTGPGRGAPGEGCGAPTAFDTASVGTLIAGSEVDEAFGVRVEGVAGAGVVAVDDPTSVDGAPVVGPTPSVWD